MTLKELVKERRIVEQQIVEHPDFKNLVGLVLQARQLVNLPVSEESACKLVLEVLK